MKSQIKQAGGRALETLERDGSYKNIDLSRIKDSDWWMLGRFMTAPPDERVRMKEDVVRTINEVQQGWLYSGGEGLQRVVADSFKLNPRFEEEFFASKLPEGLGKATAYTGIAAAGRGMGSGTAATTMVASQELAGQMFEDAIEHGATLEQAFRARDLGQMLGLIEAIPIVPLLNKLAPEARGQTMRLLMDAMKSGTEAGVKEAATVLGENLIASDFVRYDPERKAHVAVVDGATVSFTAGTIFEMLDHVFAK